MKKIILFLSLYTYLFSQSSTSYSTIFNERLGVFPNIITYENLTKSSPYYAFEGFYNVIGSKCAQIEARFGYNMAFNDHDYLCPYLAGGWLKGFKNDCKKENIFYHANIFFGALGLTYNHEILSIFHLGFRSELLLGSKVKHGKNNLTYGFEGRVPITFLYGHKGKYDLRFEPFAIFMSEKQSSNDLYGLLISLGFKF